jgi:hypothetical protein
MHQYGEKKALLAREGASMPFIDTAQFNSVQ